MSAPPVRVPGPGAEPVLAHGRSPLLARFNAAGVLGLADVHTAEALARIAGDGDEHVALATALTVRALRHGSVCVDLGVVRDTVFDNDDRPLDLDELPWPEPDAWLAACRASPLVAAADSGPGPGLATGGVGSTGRPLRLWGRLLYLERYWRQEESVRVQLEQRLGADPPTVDPARLEAGLARLFPTAERAPDAPDAQRLAAQRSATGWITVLAGGPGTGKTTTVARLLALLRDQPGPPLRVALAAPTGKAAARLQEAVQRATGDLSEADRERLGELGASTVHRLLGWRPGSHSRFRHDATNRLPHDVVVVDEMSMVSLTLMSRLLEAVRPDARLVLVGDPDQLSSVEAGAVLADITGPARPSVVRLTHNWRFGGGIRDLADAIRDADGDRVVAILRSGAADVGFAELDAPAELAGDPARGAAPGLITLRELLGSTAGRTADAARSGHVTAALEAADSHRLLCAHRRGPYGVSRWNVEVERWLTRTVPGYGAEGEFYLGRPLLVTSNDYEMGLYNGDTGGAGRHRRGGPGRLRPGC